MLATRLLLPLGLTLLGACAQHPTSLTMQNDQQNKCPLTLAPGNTLILSLPSNPTTGFRWLLKDAAAPVLRSLGPEVYSNPADAGLVGSGGESTWRFQAVAPGEAQLRLVYQQPWETQVAPADSFECGIKVK